MREVDLELLITIDDPVPDQHDDTFNHLQAKNTLASWLGKRFPGCRVEQRGEGSSENDCNKVTFGQGDWTCVLSRLTGTSNVALNGANRDALELPNQQFEIEICTVTNRKNGKIVEQKVFYDLGGMQKQIGA